MPIRLSNPNDEGISSVKQLFPQTSAIDSSSVDNLKKDQANLSITFLKFFLPKSIDSR